jgi:hypothetical protein
MFGSGNFINLNKNPLQWPSVAAAGDFQLNGVWKHKLMFTGSKISSCYDAGEEIDRDR